MHTVHGSSRREQAVYIYGWNSKDKINSYSKNRHCRNNHTDDGGRLNSLDIDKYKDTKGSDSGDICRDNRKQSMNICTNGKCNSWCCLDILKEYGETGYKTGELAK